MSAGRLYVCSTPIGNLEDASHRLIRVLSEVDVIAAEDTRRTRKLLSGYGLSARMTSYHQVNESAEAGRLVKLLLSGKNVALVSDGGTPLVSDPGYPLVRDCIAQGIAVEVVPGPSAVVAALVLSGLPSDRFVFEGFLPRKQGELRSRIRHLASDDRTIVVFESPRRVLRTLTVMREELGERPAALVREITKVHEEVLRGTLGGILEGLAEREVLGEVVLVVGGSAEGGSYGSAMELAMRLVSEGMPKSKAAADSARAHGVPRSDIYQGLLDQEEGPQA